MVSFTEAHPYTAVKGAHKFLIALYVHKPSDCCGEKMTFLGYFMVKKSYNLTVWLYFFQIESNCWIQELHRVSRPLRKVIHTLRQGAHFETTFTSLHRNEKQRVHFFSKPPWTPRMTTFLHNVLEMLSVAFKGHVPRPREKPSSNESADLFCAKDLTERNSKEKVCNFQN